MNKLLCVTLLVVFAQASFAGPKNPEQKVEAMIAQLQLDEVRADAFRTAMEEGRAERELIRKANQEAHMLAQKERLSQILTEEELTSLEGMMQRKQRGRGGKCRNM